MIVCGGTIQIGMISNEFVSLEIMKFIVFVGFVATGGSLTISSVFTTIALMYQLRDSCLSYGCRTGLFLSEVAVASKRIQVRTCI